MASSRGNAQTKARAGSGARRIAQGAGLGAGIVVLLFLVGRFAFASPYYTQWLIASGGFFCLLVAWLLRIRDSGFMGSAKSPESSKSPDAAKPSDAEKSSRAAQSVLSIAGLFLLLAATILNAFFGIGAGI